MNDFFFIGFELQEDGRDTLGISKQFIVDYKQDIGRKI